MGNSNTFSRDVRAAKSNKGVAKPKDKIIGNSSTEDWLDAFDTDEERSREGYKDTSRFRNEPYNNIYTPTGMIDMSETGIPLMANGQYLPPYSGIHNMRTPYVKEERIARYGGGLYQYGPGGTPFGPPPKSKTKFPTGPGRYSSSQGYIDADRVSKNSPWFNLEAAIEEYLGYPQTQGSNASEIVNGPPIDNIRHSVASYKTAKAIADKTKPYLGNNFGKAAGVIGANVLGLAHEIERFPNQMDQVFKRGRPIGNTLQENIQDLYNNAFGSFQVFNGMTPDGTTEYLKQQSKKGNLAKGYVDDNAYNGNPVLPKQERVLNDNTRVVKRDGGDLKQYQGDVDGSEVVNLSNQFIYPSAFQYAANTPLQNRAKECQGPDCLAGANTYYNKYVASKFGLPTSWKMLDDYGIVSGDASKPYGVSMDSWDAAAEMQAKGAIQNYAAPLYEADKKTRKDQAAAAKYWKSKTDEEKRNIYSQLALGTLVNFGDWGGIHGERLQGSNEKAGLYPSRHSTRVIGFTEDGTPMIYDMGQIRRIDDPRFEFPITNITTPKELAKYNYQYVKDWETTNNKKLNYNPKENLILTKGSQRAGEDAFTDEEFKYVEGINKNIKNLMSVTGASQEDIIKAGKVAFGIMQGETRGGRGKPKAKLKEFVKNFMPFSEEASQGLTRIKPEMQAGDETNKYSQYLKSLGLDPKNLDLWDPEQAAIATTALILSRKGDMEGVDKWYLRAQQHNTPSVGPKNEQHLKEADKDYADNIIKNTSRLYSTNTGYGLSETEKWMVKQKAEASKKRGEKAWSETLKVKPAVSESTGYAPRVIPISQLAKKEMGGESGWLDEHDLPKAQDGFNNYTQPGPLATGDPRDSFGFTFPTPVEEQVIETKKPVKKQDVVKGKQQTFFPEPGKNYNDILTSTPTYPSSKEQNTIISMSDERRAYEQNLANEKADRQLNAIKGGLNVAGLFYYPAAVAASALEFSEGNYGQSAAGLIPFVGPASRANTARNILNQASRNLLTKSYNAGIPYKIAAPIIKGAKKTTMYGANAVNAQDAYDAFTNLDEQKYGGVKKYKGLPKGTTKNVVRGINKLFLPDPKLFGPFGRKAFDPNSKFEYGGWLDNYQDGGNKKGTEQNPFQLPEVVTTPWTGAILNYEDANPKESYINNLKQAYLNNRNTQGLNKLAGVSMENFPSNVEQEYANEYLYKRNNSLAPKIIDSYSKSGDRTEWVDKLTEEEKNIIKNSDYRFDLEPNSFATSAAGLSKIFNYTGMPERYNAKMLGITENESKDIGKLNALDFMNVPGQALGSALRSPNLPGSPNNAYMNNSMMKGLQGYHDPQRLAGEEFLANPLNWTLGYDVAAISPIIGKGLLKGLKSLRRKPVQNAAFDPNHYEFSNPEMTDYFAQQPKRDLAEARIYEKKAAEKEQWLQHERDRQDALASQYSDDELENGVEIFGDSDDPFGNYQNAVNVNTPANVPNFRQGLTPTPPDPWDEITDNLKQSKKSTKAVETVKKELARDKNTTGRVNYIDVDSSDKHTLLDKSVIPSSDKLDDLINNFEEVLNHTPQDHNLRNKLVTQVEDLKSTKWLREEYAKELELRGLKPQKDLSMVTSHSGYNSLKHLVDSEGNIIASIDIDTKGYVGSSGLAHNYHGANLKRLNFEDEVAAQTALEERLKTRNLEALQNSFDRGYLDRNAFDNYKIGTESSAKKEAAETMARILRNNNNKYGEALYRGVHHGIKDTKGGLKSHKHFVDTDLVNPISGIIETAKRGKLGWTSWMNQGKAVDELDPNGIEQFRMIRSLFPYLGAGYLGSKALEEQKYGGWLDSYK